jgi:mRNA-degrading endonuclease RelE of RelBE toxin-antitoxin system
MPKIEVRATPDVAELYSKLKADDYLKKQMQKAKELMEKDNNIGDYIKNKPWPDKYVRTHDISNLYRYPIGDYYRMIYTIRGNLNAKTYQILDILTHKQYNKIFHYK